MFKVSPSNAFQPDALDWLEPQEANASWNQKKHLTPASKGKKQLKNAVLSGRRTSRFGRIFIYMYICQFSITLTPLPPCNPPLERILWSGGGPWDRSAWDANVAKACKSRNEAVKARKKRCYQKKHHVKKYLEFAMHITTCIQCLIKTYLSWSHRVGWFRSIKNHVPSAPLHGAPPGLAYHHQTAGWEELWLLHGDPSISRSVHSIILPCSLQVLTM